MKNTLTAQDLLENFSYFSDWEDKYQYIIDLGKTLSPFPEEDKNNLYKVDGCVSQVWLKASIKNNQLTFIADSDAHIVRGLIAILSIIYNEQSLDTVKTFNITAFFEQLGLGQNLLPNRRNGFFAMVGKLQELAQPH